MTDAEMARIEEEIEEYNNEREKEAREKFSRGPVPKLNWIMERLLDRLLGCIAAVKSGAAPDGHLGPYMRDELARVLATCTALSYQGVTLDEEQAMDVASYTSFDDLSTDCAFLSWTPELGLWRKVVTALSEYLHEAAVLAKSVNEASTAARLYLRAWRIVRHVVDRDDGYGCASQDEALAITRLERVASERLWIDAQFAALPPFKKAAKPRPGKAKKGKKAY
ncbi:MAG: hypothetical protein K6G91_13150 [Kiritimatiellae bacterium]|nr:hypothetical protein [Kiritimatiellia bacterium]